MPYPQWQLITDNEMENAAKSLIDFYGMKHPKVKIANRNLKLCKLLTKALRLKGFLEGYEDLEISVIMSSFYLMWL